MEKQMVSSTAKLVQQVELVELHSPDHVGSKNLRFMFLVVAALHRLGGEARRSAVQQELLADPTSKMTEGEATAVMADIESVSKLMTEARRHLVHYGLLVDHRSSWKLTPTAALVSSESELHHVAGGEAEEEMDTETWQNDVLEKLGSLTPDEFEQFVAFLMAENGVFDIEVTGRSSDGGIDGIGSLVKGSHVPVLWQAKRYQGSVGSSAVRDFRGAMMGKAHIGFMVSTGAFTKDAVSEAASTKQVQLTLIDGIGLCDWLKKGRHGVNVTVRKVEDVDADESWWEARRWAGRIER